MRAAPDLAGVAYDRSCPRRGDPILARVEICDAQGRPSHWAEFRQQIIKLARVARTPSGLAHEFGCFAQTVTNRVLDRLRLMSSGEQTFGIRCGCTADSDRRPPALRKRFLPAALSCSSRPWCRRAAGISSLIPRARARVAVRRTEERSLATPGPIQERPKRPPVSRPDPASVRQDPFREDTGAARSTPVAALTFPAPAHGCCRAC